MEQEPSTVAVPAKPDVPATPPNSAPTLIFQWLAYAFWGWLGVSLIWLGAVTFMYFIKGDAAYGGATGTIAYPLASTAVLAVIAAVCDIFYARKESAPKKTGMENVIMIIHSVIFALFGIGAIVIAVFALVNLLISTGASDENGAKITLFTSLVVAAFYLALTARVALSGHVRHIRKIAWLVMALVAGGLFAAGIVGPTVYSVQTKQDRLIESGISAVSESINEYANKNEKLPASLNELDLKSEDAKKIVAENLVEYKPNTKPAETIPGYNTYDLSALEKNLTDTSGDSTASATSNAIMPYPAQSQKRFFYQLCVNYKAEKKNEWEENMYAQRDDDYVQYVSGYDAHPKGNYCYKVSTEAYAKY